MSLRKEIKVIKEELQDLKQQLSSNVIAKAKLYDELTKNLSNVHIKLKSAKSFISPSGEEQLKIEYEVDPVFLSFDDKNEPLYNPRFYSMNITNLVSQEDMFKISKAIDKINFEKK